MVNIRDQLEATQPRIGINGSLPCRLDLQPPHLFHLGRDPDLRVDLHCFLSAVMTSSFALDDEDDPNKKSTMVFTFVDIAP